RYGGANGEARQHAPGAGRDVRPEFTAATFQVEGPQHGRGRREGVGRKDADARCHLPAGQDQGRQHIRRDPAGPAGPHLPTTPLAKRPSITCLTAAGTSAPGAARCSATRISDAAVRAARCSAPGTGLRKSLRRSSSLATSREILAWVARICAVSPGWAMAHRRVRSYARSTRSTVPGYCLAKASRTLRKP